MEIDIQDCLFNRGEDGSLLPIADKIKIGNKDKEDLILSVKYKPITRGQYYNLLQLKESGNANEKDIDCSILTENLVEPKLTKEQLNDMNPNVFTALITRIMARSFAISDNLYKENQEDIVEMDELKKKS